MRCYIHLYLRTEFVSCFLAMTMTMTGKTRYIHVYSTYELHMSCRLKRFVNFKPIFYMNYLMIYIFKLFKLLWGLVRHDLTSLLVVLHMQLSYQLTLSVIISGLDEAVLSRLLLSSIVSPLIWKENKNRIYKLNNFIWES